MMKPDSRRFVRELTAEKRTDDTHVELRAPMPGLFRHAPHAGVWLQGGDTLGELEVLGVVHRVVVPAGVRGAVVSVHAEPSVARRPVAWGEALCALDSRAVAHTEGGRTESGDTTRRARAELVFTAPISGRFYTRPTPTSEPFVKAGETIERGRAVGLLEVMKTFSRVQYGGGDLPERARVRAVLPRDGDDVNAGDVILELEELP